MKYPILLKAKQVIGKNLIFRDACITDAAFILSLRTDAKKSQHLSVVSGQLLDQEIWLDKYAARDNEVYFVIEDKTGESVGTVRLYDSLKNSFCWGSWIIKDGTPAFYAIESALMVYSYGLDTLGFESAHFQVNKGNKSVCSFHERFGATRITENHTEYQYIINNKSIREAMQRYKRYLYTPLIIKHN